MMKLLFALTFVALCQAGPLKNNVASRLQRPRLTEMTTRDENFLLFEFKWTPVESGIWTDPLIGYKMRVWEVPDAPSTNQRKEYTMSDGKYIVQVARQEEAEEEASDVTKSLENILLAEIRTPADLVTAPYFNVRIGVNYEIRVSAFTATYQSSYSDYYRVRVMPAIPQSTLDSHSIKIKLD